MKKIIFICALLLCACSDKVNNSEQDSARAKELGAMLDTMDLKFAEIMTSLERNDLTPEVKKKILCVEFPELYKNHYVPVMLEYQALTTKSMTKEQLLEDLRIISSGTSKTLKIKCDLIIKPSN